MEKLLVCSYFVFSVTRRSLDGWILRYTLSHFLPVSFYFLVIALGIWNSDIEYNCTRSSRVLRAPTSRPVIFNFGPPLGPSGLLLGLRVSSSSLMSLSSLLLLSSSSSLSLLSSFSSSSSLLLSNLRHFKSTIVQFNPQKWIPSEILMIFLFFTSKIRLLGQKLASYQIFLQKAS